MKTILNQTLRHFTINNLPKYYANVCLDKGLSYYDYKNYELTFGYLIYITFRNQDDYEIVRRLGSGRYSGAYEGINVLNNNRVTIKILKKGIIRV